MRQKLLQLFKEAVKNVQPNELIKSVISHPSQNEIGIAGEIFNKNSNFHVIGYGKAVLGMAITLVETLNNKIKSGILSVPDKTEKVHLPNFEIFEGASNNLPDNNSIIATDAILQKVSTISVDDVIILLTSGGGSSLLCRPVPGISLEDKLLTTTLLVSCGANISELNTVRKFLSTVKGGGLGHFLKDHRVINLIISDVIGDPLDIIASGPTVQSTTCPNDALEIIKKYKLDLKIPRHVISSIRNYDCQKKEVNVKNFVIGSNEVALKSVMKLPIECWEKKILVTNKVEGLVYQVASIYIKLIFYIVSLLNDRNQQEFYSKMRDWLRDNSNFNIDPMLVHQLTNACNDINTREIYLLFGGETTVEVKGNGKGGRNQELALILSQNLKTLIDEHPQLWGDWEVNILCAGTDGIDGPTDAAGAFASCDVIKKAQDSGLDDNSYLVNNDAYTFYSRLSDGEYLIKTGHTGTNVMDIHIIAISRK